MMVINWVVLALTTNPHDYKCVLDSLSDMKLENNVNVYCILFGPTFGKPCKLIYINNINIKIIKSIMCSNIKDVVPIIQKMTTLVHVSVSALYIWSHGASWGLGPWKWKEPLLSIVDLIKFFVIPLKPKLVIFDACYQGGMSCLYELPRSVEFVIASSAFHPYQSLLELPSFGRYCSFNSKKKLGEYAYNLTCEWHLKARVIYKCLLVFDTRYIKEIGILVRDNLGKLEFSNKKTRIDKKDSNLHDLFLASKNVPMLQMLIQKCINFACNDCKTNTRVNGPSMEVWLPIKWRIPFMKTRWYNEILNH
jgi:hypothetical protein